MTKLNEQRKVQFVNLSFPGNATSTAVQRRAHSHAARTAHAKARHLRMIEYHASKIKNSQIPEAEDPRGAQVTHQRRSGAPRSNLVSSLPIGATKADSHVIQLPSPISLLASDRRDPFKSFARLLKPIEHFLLDHCESSHHPAGSHHPGI